MNELHDNLRPKAAADPNPASSPASESAAETAGNPAAESAESAESPKTAESAKSAESARPARSGSKFPTVGDLFAMLGITLGFSVGVGVLGSVIALLFGFDPAAATPEAFGRYTCLLYLASMLPALLVVLYYRRRRGGRGPWIQCSLKGLNPLLLLWGCLFLSAVSIVIEPLLSLLPLPQINLGRGPWTFLMAVCFAPVLEELLCRGVVLGSCRQKWGVIYAWIVSSLFFGILHLAPLLVVNACIMGLILGYLYIATESIWMPILLHAFNNLISYLLLVSGREEIMLIQLIGSRTLYALIYAAAVVIALLSVYMMRSTLLARKEREKIGPTAQ